MGLIISLIRRAVLINKVRKIDTAEKYFDYVDSCRYEDSPLTVGDTDKLKETSYKNIFQHIYEYDELLEKYNLKQIAGNGNDFEKAVAVMQWLTDNTMYNGQQLHFLPDDTIKILDFSFGKPFKYAINCRDKAIVLTDLLIAIGIRAYPIALVDEKRWGNHFVVHVYCKECNKWAMLDPSFNACFTDESGKMLNVYELRNLFLENKMPIIKGYNFNGTEKCKNNYINYFIKQCLTNISTWQDNSMDCRIEPRKWSKKKSFDYKLPPLEEIQQVN
ncbi:MAG: transglutaminase domain-containing protein [Clostridiales bacterium]|nr:transglutaminase domain-containing protein [Clostridiales bacterium]